MTQAACIAPDWRPATGVRALYTTRQAGDMADHDCGRSARNTRHPVMFSEPIALIAPTLGVLRQIESIA